MVNMDIDIQLDIARYQVEWYMIACANNKTEIESIKLFARNVATELNFPVEIVVTEYTENKISCYIYVFPDEETHNRYRSESDYEPFNFK